MRRALKVAGGATIALLLLLGAAALALPHVELGPFVAGRATAALGRTVAIGSLRLTPGRDLSIALRDLRVAEFPDGSAPDLARIGRLDARLALLPLLAGGLVVREAELEGVRLLLERDGAGRRNWRFGSGRPRADPGPEALPLLHALRLADAEIVVRTSAGARLVTRIDQARLTSADPLVASTIEAEGSYNAAPISARVELGPLAEFRQGRALAVTLHGRSGDTALAFDGTTRDPLNADRAEGRLTLVAPTPEALLRMAQMALPVHLNVSLAGQVRRDGPLWQLRDVEGRLFDAPFHARLVQMNEGGAGEPDAIVADLGFTRLDLNRILAAGGPGEGRSDRDADLPLLVPIDPDPRLDVRLRAAELAYARLAARDVELRASQHPGRIAIETLQLGLFGARVRAHGALEPAARGARLTAQAALVEGELDSLRRAIGAAPLPLAGPVQARLSIAAEGGTLNAAWREAEVAAVVAMAGGTVARSVIEMASTNLRALFRSAPGSTHLSCLLAVVEMRARRGEASPLRLRAATGTVVGQGRFDLSHRTLDLVIGSQRATTEFLALDIPVRVYGSFTDPDIGLADWSPASRARLAAGDDLSGLPEALADFARANPCYQPPRRR